MSSRPLLGEGAATQAEYVDSPNDSAAEFASRIADLERRLLSLEASQLQIKRDAVVLMLGLFSSALRRVAAGELDIDPADTSTTSSSSSKWDIIKQRNPGRIAQAIDVLLVHGRMNTSQLAAAMRMDRSNCSNNVVTKLKSMGLIIKEGNDFQLKEL